MVKRGKLPKMKVPALGGLTKNKYVLYLLLVVALVNVVGYLQVNNLDSLGLFIVSGLLASCFTKNMIVILAIAIFMGMCKTCTNYFSLGRVLEGMENEEEEEEEEEDEEDEVDEGFIGFREGFKEGNMAKKGNKKKSGKGKKGNKCTKVYRLAKASKGKKCKEACKKNCKSGDAYCGTSQSTCEGKEKFGNRNNVPSSEPASLVDDDETDSADGKRIDYAATLEMAYDNLDKMLGKKGMKGLTQETSKLAKQQKGLMESLKGMAPIMQNAKATLESMNLPEINKMASMMQNINQGKRAQK